MFQKGGSGDGKKQEDGSSDVTGGMQEEGEGESLCLERPAIKFILGGQVFPREIRRI